jgi:hypothetical protein
LYKTALELIPEDDESRRSLVRRRLAVALQALFHVQDVELLRAADGQPETPVAETS